MKPLEFDASHLANGHTETLLNHHNSSASIIKQGGGSVRTNEDSSFNESSFINQDFSRENALKQADVLHSYGWEARKKQDFPKAI